MSRKQPTPPPDGITKPEPPPAPPLKVGRVHLGAHAGLPEISVDVPMPSVRPPRRDDRERTAYRGESSAAGVVTKRIDRGDGAFELSFYAIGPKRSTYAEAVGDLQGFAEPADRAWIYCSDRLPETAGRYEVALFAPGGYPEHPYLARHFATWMHRGEWNTGLRPEQVVYAWRPIVEAPPPLRPADRDFLLAAGVPAEWLEPKGD